MTQQQDWWPDGPPPAHPQPPAYPQPEAHPQQATVHSGPVSPWSHPAYLPPVDPVPSLVQPPVPGVVPTGMPPGHGVAPVRPPPPDAQWRPARVEAVPGTDFGVVHLQVAPVTSGLAVGALMAGIAALVVGFLVLCFGVAGASAGWGAWVAGAFTVLGLVAGGGGVGLGLTALRQIRRSGQPGLIRFTGRGPALTGVWCGGIGLGVCLLSLATAVLLQVV